MGVLKLSNTVGVSGGFLGGSLDAEGKLGVGAAISVPGDVPVTAAYLHLDVYGAVGTQNERNAGVMAEAAVSTFKLPVFVNAGVGYGFKGLRESVGADYRFGWKGKDPSFALTANVVHEDDKYGLRLGVGVNF